MGNESVLTTPEDRFGRAVRMEREKRGWTQADLAHRLAEFGLRLHPSAIAKIELRDVERPRAIRIDEADVIAAAFGLSVDAMTSGDADLDRIQSLRKEIQRAGHELSRWDILYRSSQRDLKAEIEKLDPVTRSLLTDEDHNAIADALASRPQDHLDAYSLDWESSQDAPNT